eukprot:g4951.t1
MQRTSYKPLYPPHSDDDNNVRTMRQNRNCTELRPRYMKTGIVTRARGSGYVEAGDCKVLCSVFGPRESSRAIDFSETGLLQVDVKFAPFAEEIHRGKGRAFDEEHLSHELSCALESAVLLEKFPKSVVDVYVVVLESGGGLMAAATTAASLALADAGIEMFDLVVGCAAGKVGDSIAMDLNSTESLSTSAIMSLAMMPALQEVTYMSESGEMNPQDTTYALEQCLEGCVAVHSLMVKTLKQ